MTNLILSDVLKLVNRICLQHTTLFLKIKKAPAGGAQTIDKPLEIGACFFISQKEKRG